MCISFFLKISRKVINFHFFQAELLTKVSVKSVDEAKIAARKLIEKGCSQVIITLGSLGALYTSKNDKNPIYVSTRKVTAVDTTVSYKFLHKLNLCSRII